MPSAPPNKRPPCPTHGLATGPDGLCTLCRRAARPPSEAKLPLTVVVEEDGSRLVTRLLGLGLMLSIVGAAAYAFNTSGGMVGAGAALAPEPPSRGIARREQPRPKPRRPEQVTGGAAAAPEQPQPEKTASVSAVLTAEEIERKRRLDLETAEQDRRRSEQIEADRIARAQRRARGNVRVMLYSTSWCGYCKKARQYMTEAQIAFVEHDIDASDSARAIMKRLNPSGSVPTFEIDDEVLIGFSSESLEQTIETAIRKRAGG